MPFRSPRIVCRWAIVLTFACFTMLSVQARGPAPTIGFGERFELIKAEATAEELYRFLYDLPKGGDIHNHLGGSSRSEWWYALAVDEERNGGYRYYTKTEIHNCPSGRARPVGARPYLLYFHNIQASTYAALDECKQREYQAIKDLDDEQRSAWLSSLRLDGPGQGRDEFFERIWARLGELLRNPYINAELLVENMKRFGAEGVRYLETQTGATGYVGPDGTPMSTAAVVDLYRERLRQPDAIATGVIPRFQQTVLRFTPDANDSLRRAYAFVAEYRDLWVGINMAGREDDDRGHPERFRDTFREMRRTHSGIGLSIHAGETDRPSRHVRETLLLGATRIGHGIDVIHDDETMLLMRDGPYLIETNLISNQLLEYIPEIETHPFPEFLRFGIPVALTTDDRGMWDSNMTDEYYTAVTHFDLSWNEIVRIGRASLEHAFVEDELKVAMLEAYDADIAAFELKYAVDDWREMLSDVAAETYTYGERQFGFSFP